MHLLISGEYGKNASENIDQHGNVFGGAAEQVGEVALEWSLFCMETGLGLDVSTEETAVDRCSRIEMGIALSDLNMGCLEMGSRCSVTIQSVLRNR